MSRQDKVIAADVTDADDVVDAFQATVGDFLLEVAQDETLPDDVRDEAYHWWRSESDEFTEPDAAADVGQEAG